MIEFESKNQTGLLIPKRNPLQVTSEPQMAKLGRVVDRTDIRSSMGPFHYLPEYTVPYPETVTKALSEIYAEYNLAFDPLIKANREWDTDYQHGMHGPNRTPSNHFVQIDMIGLPEDYLKTAANLDIDSVREDLKGRIFEIENSLAMYQLLIKIFAQNDQDSRFGSKFRRGLDIVREINNRPIALLAVTDQKYQAMKESEFGKADNETLSNEEIREMSGFDTFFGPADFINHLSQNGGESDYLLYVRSSDPVSKLRKPNTEVENPLLSDETLREVIKKYAVTFNIDNPEWPTGDNRRINDTKEYLITMGMAFPISADTDLDTEEFRKYLILRGYDLEGAGLRAKPMQSSYGCYGHLRSIEKKFRQELRREIRQRGPYVIQPEMQTPVILNETDGRTYTYIDRNFFSSDGKNFEFMGGFRSLMPMDSIEAQKGRVHGNGSTVWAEIY